MPDAFHQFESIHARHSAVDENETKARLPAVGCLDRLEGCPGAFHGCWAHPPTLCGDLENAPVGRIVIDNQYGKIAQVVQACRSAGSVSGRFRNAELRREVKNAALAHFTL